MGRTVQRLVVVAVLAGLLAGAWTLGVGTPPGPRPSRLELERDRHQLAFAEQMAERNARLMEYVAAWAVRESLAVADGERFYLVNAEEAPWSP